MLCPKCLGSGIEVIPVEGLSPYFNIANYELRSSDHNRVAQTIRSGAIMAFYEADAKADYYTRVCQPCFGSGGVSAPEAKKLRALDRWKAAAHKFCMTVICA